MTIYKKVIKEYYLPSGTVSLNSSLLTRLLEYAKETSNVTDEHIHKIVELALEWNEEYEVLNMDCYQALITGLRPTE